MRAFSPPAVFRETGCWGVAEAAALAAVGPQGCLLAPKRKGRGVTCALAVAPHDLDPPAIGRPQGRLALIGLGPGGPDWRTAEAERLLAEADELVGYGLYLDLVGPAGRGKPHHAFPLGAETERVLPQLLAVYVRNGRYRLALDRAERHLATHPNDDRMRLLTGALHAALGSDAHAVEHFERILARSPNHSAAHYALATLLRGGCADAVGADRHFREYLRLDPGGPHAEEARASLLEEVE